MSKVHLKKNARNWGKLIIDIDVAKEIDILNSIAEKDEVCHLLKTKNDRESVKEEMHFTYKENEKLFLCWKQTYQWW